MVLALLLSLLIGLSLGLLGGGGSILTVPILIYALGMEEKSAIATSLLVVGLTSLVAALQHARASNVVWRVALPFAAAGMAGASLGGRLAKFVPAPLLLTLFAVIMLATALGMWRGRREVAGASNEPAPSLPLLKIGLLGVAVGLVTGLVGAGGGFLVVPALALLGRLPMKKAVGSSLVVITLNSLAGFFAFSSHARVDLRLAAIVTSSAVMGTLVGTSLVKRVPQAALRRGFAVFVFAMAIYMLLKQLF